MVFRPVTTQYHKKMISIILAVSLCSSHILAESLGPPKNSRGTIDWRYPDEIVQPLPDCPLEGVYPHPVNCTWYYRCHDRMDLGFYFRTYYECEPGTVFSDELDQCVFPHDTSPPCGISTGQVTKAPVGPSTGDSSINVGVITSTNATISVGPPAVSVTATGSTNVVGPPGVSVTDPTNTVRPLGPSEAVTGSSTSSPTPITTVNSNTSVKPVTEDSSTSGPITGVLFPTGGGNNTMRCVVQYDSCKTEHICPSGTTNMFTWELCEARQICYFNGKEEVNRPFCTDNSFYNPQYQRCYFAPQDADVCKNSTDGEESPISSSITTEESASIPPTTIDSIPEVTTTPETDQKPPVIIVTDQNVVTCSSTNQRPQHDWIIRKFCNSFALCDSSGKFLTAKKLCSRYYQCSRLADAWETLEMSCENDKLFSFEEDQCVDIPKREEMCFRFLRYTGLKGVPTPFFKF